MILYMCNRKIKVEHCIEHCHHGKPHEVDGCTCDELCYIESKKGVVVKCCPATKKELLQYEEALQNQKNKKPMGPWAN